MKAPKVRKWVLSSHAALRAEERGITAHEIQELLKNPDHAVEQGPKWVFTKAFTKRRDNMIAAVLIEKQEKNLWLVITVMNEFELKK